jgi:hypothetical protein
MSYENATRAKLGLRVIQPSWYLYSVEFDEENWKIVSTGYQAKKLHRDPSGKLLWEQDYYYSGRTFVDFKGGEEWEMLAVDYNYNTRSLAVDYVGQDPPVESLIDKLTPGSTIKEKFSVADQVLKKWSLTRL